MNRKEIKSPRMTANFIVWMIVAAVVFVAVMLHVLEGVLIHLDGTTFR
jgi:hypothetical protein